MAAMRHAFTPAMLAKEVNFSPTEVADRGLLMGLKRPTIYKWIKAGEIKTTLDQYGHHRITLEEIERVTKLWRERAERAATDTELKDEIQRHLNRSAVLHRLATTNVSDVVAPLLAGKRASLIRAVDPKGTCSPEELERRIAIEEESRMEKLTAKRLAKEKLRRQYGRSASNPP